MRASEWQFLCAVHETPKSCCAIDYCCHTLDWATNIVTSQKIFPSRLSLGAGDAIDDRGAGVKHLVNIFRRLHRIFAHAWFQHRGVFWQVEGQTGLYVLFKTVCDTYELLPAENYKLPPEAEGLEPVQEFKNIPTILKSEVKTSNSTGPLDTEDPSFISVGRTNTRRHIRSSPSTGSAVTTVQEAEEYESEMSQRPSQLIVTETESIPEEGDYPDEFEAYANGDVEGERDVNVEIISEEDPRSGTVSREEEEKEEQKQEASLPSTEEENIEILSQESPTLPIEAEAATENASLDTDAGAGAEAEAEAEAVVREPEESSEGDKQDATTEAHLEVQPKDEVAAAPE